MDPRRFDTLTKALSTSGTRRGVLAALLAGPFELLGLSQPAQGRKRRGGRDVTIQGPCGDGSGPDNVCERPADCCTGICERTQPGKPKRCRCRRRGEACTKTRNCCQGAEQNLVCTDETCRVKCGPFVEPCPGNPQCGTFGKPCPGDAQCVAGLCGGNCPSASFSCVGSRGGECCAQRADCCVCRDNATGESYGYCSSSDPSCSSFDFGPDVVCGHV